MTNSNDVSRLSFEDFTSYINQARQDWLRREQQIYDWVSDQPLLLFGFGGKGQALAHQIQDLTGRQVTIYDSSLEKRDAARLQGFAVIDKLSADAHRQWVTVLAACQAQIEQRLTIKARSLFYQEAASFFKTPHLAHKSSDFGDYVYEHIDEHYRVYLSLHSRSRERFLSILRFRVSNDPGILQTSRQPVAEMWLDIPTLHKVRDYSTFVDVGAYDGDTLGSFQNRFGCTRAIAVEANTSLFNSINKVGVRYSRGIEIMPMAAWSKNTRLMFHEVRGGMIQVTESQHGELEAAPIDQFVHEPVDCLKMDIEGAESEALAGCRLTLSESRPDLAIAAYHRPQDLLELSKQINTAGYAFEEFDWHIGHYSDCLDDSIFYVLQKY